MEAAAGDGGQLVPEVIPEAVLIIGAFFLFACALILRGLLAGYNYSFGSMFAWLAEHLKVRIPTPPFGHVTVNFGSPFGVINDVITSSLQAGIKDCEKYLAYTWHAAEKLLRYTAEAIDYLARETEQTFSWLAHVKLPRWAKVILAGALPVGLLTKLIAEAVSKIHPTVTKIVRVIEHTVTHTVPRVVVKTVAVAVPGIHAIPGIRRDIVGLTKRNLRLSRRLSRVEGLFAAGVMAAVLANVLGVATRCIRRGNVAKAARSICGLDSNLFESLLGDLIAITSVLSVVEFATELRAIEDEAIGIMGKLVREWPS